MVRAATRHVQDWPVAPVLAASAVADVVRAHEVAVAEDGEVGEIARRSLRPYPKWRSRDDCRPRPRQQVHCVQVLGPGVVGGLLGVGSGVLCVGVLPVRHGRVGLLVAQAGPWRQLPAVLVAREDCRCHCLFEGASVLVALVAVGRSAIASAASVNAVPVQCGGAEARLWASWLAPLF